MSTAAAAPRPGSRAPSRTVMPRPARRATTSRPMPRLAPVTSAMVVSFMPSSPPGAARWGQHRSGSDQYPGGMDRLETRDLRYFVAVAEELHFGRAADRLGIAQPPLSRAIRQIERRVGVPLLTRTSRHVALTPAGEVLLHEARKALDAVLAAGVRARRAGAAERRLVLVMKPGGDAGL